MTTKTELVFIPTPVIGHLVSTIELAKLIVKTNDNISILVLIYQMPYSETTKVEAYIESQLHSLVDQTRITFINLPPLSNPPDPTSFDYFAKVLDLQKPLVEQALAGRETKPAAFVLDLLNANMIDVAKQMFDIPSYIYFIDGLNMLHTVLHLQALVDEKGVNDAADLVTDLDTELDLPGFKNRLPGKVLPWILLDKESVFATFMLQLAKRYREAKGILVNTFLDFESSTLQALQKQDKVPTVYPVGPLLALEGRGDSKPSKNEDDIIGWLDKQPRSSVVFLCFGSLGCFGADQVKEMADGIERSGHRFLWSLRKPKDCGSGMQLPSEETIFHEALPEGFLDRTAQKGKLIAWAPQVSVLAHPAIGGFVSHCGWNSTLESVWFGVPIATWPIYSEQQLNAFTLVKELGIAVEISIDYRWDFKEQRGTSIITATEIENSIKKLMNMDPEMKKKVSEISEKSKKALLADGGSSHDFLARFIQEVTQKSDT